MSLQGPQPDRRDPDSPIDRERSKLRSSPTFTAWVVIVALGGFVVGVFMWGSLVSWTVAAILDSTDDILPEASAGNDNPGNDEVIVDAVEELDCDELSAERTLSPARESEFQEQCGSSFLDGERTPTATATEVPLTATPTIPPTDNNRFNCENIRGTNYRSDEERTWFLEQCLTPTP